jgi:hypothetical protein
MTVARRAWAVVMLVVGGGLPRGPGARAASAPPGAQVAVGLGVEKLGATLPYPTAPVASLAGGWTRAATTYELRASWSELHYDTTAPGSPWERGYQSAHLRLLGLAFSQQWPLPLAWARLRGGYELASAHVAQSFDSALGVPLDGRSSWTVSGGLIGQVERPIVGPVFVRVEIAAPLRLLKVGDDDERARARWTVGWRASLALGGSF